MLLIDMTMTVMDNDETSFIREGKCVTGLKIWYCLTCVGNLVLSKLYWNLLSRVISLKIMLSFPAVLVSCHS